MNNDPSKSFSIIMPTYNSYEFVENSIISIINQTFESWELIIVDDCSTDKTIHILKEFEKKDSRIHLFSLKKNSGPCIARNEGIKNAQNRFIAFIDSDDQWLPQKLENQYNVFLNEKPAICFSSYIKRYYKDNNIFIDHTIKVNKKISFNDIRWINYIGCSTAAYDSYTNGKVFMANIRYAEDYSLWLKILSYGNIAYCIEEPQVIYTVRKYSESSNKIRASIGHWNALKEFSKANIFHRFLFFLYYVVVSLIKRYAYK